MATTADKQLTGLDLIRAFKERHGDTTLLAFSRGKDAIATAIAIRDHLNIVPVHYTIVPGLEFIEEGLAYYEKHLFGRHIIQMPHPSFYRQLGADFLHQNLANAEVITSAQLLQFDHEYISDIVIEQEGLDKNTFNAIGVRAADSPMRRTAMNKYGPIRPKQKSWFPVWNWDKAKLVDEIKKSGISLPIDYFLWGRSFDGIDARFSLPMKKYLPKDFARLKEWFPLVDVELMRYEMHTGDTSWR